MKSGRKERSNKLIGWKLVLLHLDIKDSTASPHQHKWASQSRQETRGKLARANVPFKCKEQFLQCLLRFFCFFAPDLQRRHVKVLEKGWHVLAAGGSGKIRAPPVCLKSSSKNWRPDTLLLWIQNMSSFNDLVFWGVNKEVLSINRIYYSKFNQRVYMHFKGREISEDHSEVYVLSASRCSSSNAVSNFMSHQNTSLYSHCARFICIKLT